MEGAPTPPSPPSQPNRPSSERLPAHEIPDLPLGLCRHCDSLVYPGPDHWVVLDRPPSLIHLSCHHERASSLAAYSPAAYSPASRGLAAARAYEGELRSCGCCLSMIFSAAVWALFVNWLL